MAEQIFNVTIFMCMVLLLRSAFYRRISKRLCYAMWLVVAVYLLVPQPSFSNSFQVMNVLYRAVEHKKEIQAEDKNAGDRKEQGNDAEDTAKTPAIAAQPDGAAGQNSGSDDTVWTSFKKGDWSEPANEPEEQRTGSDDGFAVPKSLQENGNWISGIWLLGVFICGTVFAVSNLRFGKRVRKNRQILEMGGEEGYCSIPVYRTKEVHTPCLFGVFHPAVYFPAEGMAFENDEKKREACYYVLAHEYMHYRHKDHLWAVLRCLCVILYWYHPLVWAAAFLSMKDSEFACDESVTRTYGKQERKAYGENLILFGTQRMPVTSMLKCATGMTGGRRELKERITLIANPKKQWLCTAVFACLLLFGITGCTLGSPAQNSPNTENVEDFAGEQDTSSADTEAEEEEEEENTESEDTVPKPIDFAALSVEKVEENGIGYYKLLTDKMFPLPLNEWAKINLFTEQGNAVDAYVRFTDVTHDKDAIAEHVETFCQARGIQGAFQEIETEKTEYVMLHYEILAAEDAELPAGDKILPTAMDFPVQMYSTLENGRFWTNDSEYQGMERSVWDASIIEADTVLPGERVEKTMICSIPKGYTAYGLQFFYITADRNTGMVYFKPEYAIE
ncbi:MAG: M56 family metallopeptidase [Clostridium sp.]|nr:M56 family metallopeptidase [Clostridium sp.]